MKDNVWRLVHDYKLKNTVVMQQYNDPKHTGNSNGTAKRQRKNKEKYIFRSNNPDLACGGECSLF